MSTKSICQCCSHPAIKGTPYCGLHQNCTTSKSASLTPHTRFETHQQIGLANPRVLPDLFDYEHMTDDQIQLICRQLNYKDLSQFVKVNRRIHNIGQVYLTEEKKKRMLENRKRIQLYVLTKDNQIVWLDLLRPIPDEINLTSFNRLILPRTKKYWLDPNQWRGPIYMLDPNNRRRPNYPVQQITGPVKVKDLYELFHDIVLKNYDILHNQHPYLHEVEQYVSKRDHYYVHLSLDSM